MRKFTEDHDWLECEDEPKAGGSATIGITHYAQEQLGDIVYVQLPKVGDALQKGGFLATVESVKAASDISSPISGAVTAVNDAVLAESSLINTAAETDGWLVTVTYENIDEINALLSDEEYKNHIS